MMAENHGESIASYVNVNDTIFMSITGADASTAQQYLEVTNWSLTEAVNLYMETSSQGHTGGGQSSSDFPPPAPGAAYSTEDEVRAPDPSTRHRLVGADAEQLPIRRLHDQYRDFAAESIAALTSAHSLSTSPFVHSDSGSNSSRDLNSLFQPPVNLMFKGTYSEARALAKNETKWLLVNIQDEVVFASHMLNRDVWSDEVVQNVVASGFVFWQHHWVSEHGKRFCTLYRIERDAMPLIAIVNPKTGEIAAKWIGFLSAADMTEKLSDFCFSHTYETEAVPQPQRFEQPAHRDIADASEDDQLAAAIAASLEGRNENDDVIEIDSEEEMEDVTSDSVEELPEEPADGTPDVTRVQIRSPDGTRLTRRFLKSDPISLLWIYVKDQIPEARHRSFEIRTAFPPAAILFSENESFVDRNLMNASLMVKWI